MNDLFDGAGLAPAPPESALRFIVYGTPQPAGSKAARPYRKKDTGKLGVAVRDTNPKSAPWKHQVAQAAGEAMHGRAVMEGPLELTVTFYRMRPKGNFGTGKNAGKLKGSAPWYPLTKPDALKLGRAVEDAMSKVVYRDDAQIVSEHLFKRWGVPERAVVEVRRVGTPDPEPYSEELGF